MSTDIVQSLPQSPGVWKQAWLRLKNDRVGMVSLYVISALFGLFQGGIVPSYAIIVREYFPAQKV